MITKLVMFILCYTGNGKAIDKLLDFDTAVQDWVNENYISSFYYLFSVRISTVKWSDFYSSEIILHLSNCSRSDFPIDMVRKKNGCSSIGSTDDAIICTALHRGLHVPFQKYMEPLLQCHKANSSATFEAEKKILLHWKLAYASLISGLE
ncbi:hypothetical protein T11_17116 [Trichinella zimbabwensis]|uniref:Uncharacterized protein n=1 Tax=Trichinella zimbabwensis TaxID=268475 RepID=A0A0V1I8N9_9BILA|nr:hypothetical protein T11_17116 [Trichinella zimbabwensis]